jgi:hypothetical protein
MADDTVTLHIEGPNDEDDVTLPTEMLNLMREADESDAEIVGDLALFSCAQRIHATVHHAEGGDTEEYKQIEERTMDLFEERFGASFRMSQDFRHDQPDSPIDADDEKGHLCLECRDRFRDFLAEVP